MELARDVNHSNAQPLRRRKDPEASLEKKEKSSYSHLSMRHQPEIVNLYRVMSSNPLMAPSLPAVLLELPVSVI